MKEEKLADAMKAAQETEIRCEISDSFNVKVLKRKFRRQKSQVRHWCRTFAFPLLLL